MVVALIIIGVILFILIMVFVPVFPMAKKIYNQQLVRTSKEKWGLECSAPDNEEQVRMYQIGLDWATPYKSKSERVEVNSEGFNLVGEYFDFGYKRAVIILQGRAEAHNYSYYFASPYKEAKYNVLVIDTRSHGDSDGKYNALGLKEYKDVLKWAELLHDKYHNEKILLHGICIGSATALYALTSENAPDYIQGMVADGMYPTFYESFKNHLIVDKRPIYPFINEVFFLVRIHAGVDAVHNGPIKSIKKLEKPILFLHSKEDVFSLPERAKELYELCPSSKKKIVFFDKGAHSHIRINNTEKYDTEIKTFIKETFDE